MKGFKINRLVSTGETVENKTIEFNSGLNIITGPSDTGKTYIFEAINYLLGAGTPPKKIDQSAHYLVMYLEIEELSTNSIFTISRSLLSPTEDIVIYDSCYSEIDSVSPIFLHYESHKTKPNISKFLLEKCGFDSSSYIRTNTNYKKENFTFRSYIPYSMVSETKMIAENSPIYNTNNYTSQTKYLYQFKYLITHDDDGDVEEAVGKNIFDATKTANIDLLKNLLDNELEKEELLIDRINAHENLNDNDYISILLTEIQSEISDLNKNISNLEYDKVRETESFRYNQGILKRFEILKQQYFSDIERLQFINEGSFLMNQLVVNKCPHCGKEIEISNQNHEDLNLEMVGVSCDYEIAQINLKLLELDESIKTTLTIISNSENQIAKLQKELDDNYYKLNNRLTPELDSLNKKFIQIADVEKSKSELSLVEDKIKQYKNLITEFNTKKILSYSSPNKTALELIEKTSFNATLRNVIKQFYFQKQDIKIDFYFNDSRELDFKINNTSRISRGKGSRALLMSAFFIAARNYCQKENFPHANFLILDSPINAFKDLKKNEALESSIKNKFLNYLASEKTQTIIMENIDINDIHIELKNKINIIEFTKSTDYGRYGFY